MTIWNQLEKLKGKELSATLDVGEGIDLLMDKSIPPSSGCTRPS